jgi:hypothetical protein
MAVAELAGREAELRPDHNPAVNIHGIEELVADKGYHSGLRQELTQATRRVGGTQLCPLLRDRRPAAHPSNASPKLNDDLTASPMNETGPVIRAVPTVFDTKNVSAKRLTGISPLPARNGRTSIPEPPSAQSGIGSSTKAFV